MRKKEKILTGILVVGLVAAFMVYDYVFNAEHRDIANEDVFASITANEISNQFQTNEKQTTTEYLDQVIQVTGVITAIEDQEIVLDGSVQIGFINNSDAQTLTNNEKITIKGRCVGYDELLELVKIDQSTLINN